MSRTAVIARITSETSIEMHLDLDGTGSYEVHTGVGFFDHMLSHVAKHGGLDITVSATGDLHVDEHHLVEDIGICLGQCLVRALGDKRGICRFGAAFVPMDEALARTVIDLSGRSYLAFAAAFSRESINGFSTELVQDFFQAVANEGRMNIHVSLLYGRNAHHEVEAVFKSFGRALGAAIRKGPSEAIPSTKGIL